MAHPMQHQHYLLEYLGYLHDHDHEDSLDILVNNAGAAWGEPYENFSEKGWDKVMDTNVKSMFFLTRDLTPALAKNASDDEPS